MACICSFLRLPSLSSFSCVAFSKLKTEQRLPISFAISSYLPENEQTLNNPDVPPKVRLPAPAPLATPPTVTSAARAAPTIAPPVS